MVFLSSASKYIILPKFLILIMLTIYLCSLLSDWDQKVGSDLIQRYIATNELSSKNPLTKTTAASLGQLLCGMTSEQWKTLVSADVFPVLITEYLATFRRVVGNG